MDNCNFILKLFLAIMDRHYTQRVVLEFYIETVHCIYGSTLKILFIIEISVPFGPTHYEKKESNGGQFGDKGLDITPDDQSTDIKAGETHGPTLESKVDHGLVADTANSNNFNSTFINENGTGKSLDKDQAPESKDK